MRIFSRGRINLLDLRRVHYAHLERHTGFKAIVYHVSCMLFIRNDSKCVCEFHMTDYLMFWAPGGGAINNLSHAPYMGISQNWYRPLRDVNILPSQSYSSNIIWAFNLYNIMNIFWELLCGFRRWNHALTGLLFDWQPLNGWILTIDVGRGCLSWCMGERATAVVATSTKRFS